MASRVSWIPANFTQSSFTLDWLRETLSQKGPIIQDLQAAMENALHEKEKQYTKMQRDLSTEIVQSQLDVVGTLCKYGERKGVLYYIKDDGSLGTFVVSDKAMTDEAPVIKGDPQKPGFLSEMNNPTMHIGAKKLLEKLRSVDPEWKEPPVIGRDGVQIPADDELRSRHQYTEDEVRLVQHAQQCMDFTHDWLASFENDAPSSEDIEFANIMAPHLMRYVDIQNVDSYDKSPVPSDEYGRTIMQIDLDTFFDLYDERDDVKVWVKKYYLDVKFMDIPWRNDDTLREEIITQIWKVDLFPQIRGFYQSFYTTLNRYKSKLNFASTKLMNQFINEVQDKVTAPMPMDFRMREDIVEGLIKQPVTGEPVSMLPAASKLIDKGTYRGGDAFDYVKEANQSFFSALIENERIVAIRDKIAIVREKDFMTERLPAFQRALNDLDDLNGREKIKNEVAKMCVAFIVNPMMYTKQYLTFSLTGGAGTGKTALAVKLAKVLSTLGALVDGTVTIASRATIVGQYVGETADKVRRALKRNLENVYFIDEAYSVAQTAPGSPEKFDHYGVEAINEIVAFLDKNKGKIAIITAGYKCEMDEYFFGVNPGMQRRFKYHWNLDPFSPETLLCILASMLRKSSLPLTKIATPDAIKFLVAFMKERVDPTKDDMTFADTEPGEYIYRRMFQNEAGDIEQVANALKLYFESENEGVVPIGDEAMMKILMGLVYDRDGDVEIRVKAAVDPLTGVCTSPKFPAIFKTKENPLSISAVMDTSGNNPRSVWTRLQPSLENASFPDCKSPTQKETRRRTRILPPSIALQPPV